jgi:hypothetical protein
VILRTFRWGVLLLLLGTIAGPASAVYPGDVNRNSQVGVDDAVMILRFVVGADFPTTEQIMIGDVYPLRPGIHGRTVGEEPLDVQDAITILQYSVGLLTWVDIGLGEVFLAISPRVAELGPNDRLQFTAVPFGFDGPAEWALTAEPGKAVYGSLSTDGLYVAPSTLPRFASVLVQAKVSSATATATVFLSSTPPPPPPPPPGG